MIKKKFVRLIKKKFETWYFDVKGFSGTTVKVRERNDGVRKKERWRKKGGKRHFSTGKRDKEKYIANEHTCLRSTVFLWRMLRATSESRGRDAIVLSRKIEFSFGNISWKFLYTISYMRVLPSITGEEILNTNITVQILLNFSYLGKYRGLFDTGNIVVIRVIILRMFMKRVKYFSIIYYVFQVCARIYTSE
jgi:hypothetical protein